MLLTIAGSMNTADEELTGNVHEVVYFRGTPVGIQVISKFIRDFPCLNTEATSCKVFFIIRKTGWEVGGLFF